MNQQRVNQNVVYRAVLLAALLVILGLLFRELVTLMLAVLMTVILAVGLAAWTTRLERRGIPRPVGAAMGILGGLAVVAGVLALVIPPFVADTDKFVNEVPGIVDDLRHKAQDVTGARPGEIGDRVQTFLHRYTDHPEKLIGPVTSIGLNLAGVLGALILMLITAFYIAIRPEPLVQGALRLFPPAQRGSVLHVMERLRAAWIGWMGGVAVHMLIAGTFIYAGLTIIGVQFAVVFAVLTALLVVIPYFGAIASAIPPTLFALTDSPGKALLVLGVYVLVHQLEGNVIIPLVMSRAVKLHPAVIAVGVVVVGELLGLVGLFVAVPLLSMLVICVEEGWVKPMEQADRRSAELDRDDHGGDEHADDDDHLHPDPEARHVRSLT